MPVVNIHEAKTHLSRLIRAALAGDEVVIARANRPLVKLVVVEEAVPARRFGTAEGEVRIHEDFDDPIEDFVGYS